MFIFVLPLILPILDHGQKDDDGDEGVAGEVAAKQPKKKRPPKRTVEQNLSNINSSESERKCEVRSRLYRKLNSGSSHTNERKCI